MQNQYSSFTFFTVIVCQISVVEQEVQFPLKGREKKVGNNLKCKHSIKARGPQNCKSFHRFLLS